jgi:hypothetical protein
MEHVKRTTEVSSDLSRACEHCGQLIGGYAFYSLTDGINHFIEKHGYRLLHLGTRTQRSKDGQPQHREVAILGHDDPPPVRQFVEIEMDFSRLGGP